MSSEIITIHPLNIQPGDFCVTVTSDVEISVWRKAPKKTRRERVHAILLEVQKRGGGNFVADLDSYTDRVMSVLGRKR